ncbi:MAG: putative toxin-antitoxin system toxin component, PIN family [Alphaproteobacteria bacterium]|nr:MAG: putative toxin-antitoxin system toxin component, PIN family [Alphaproteobacteria bacterium]TAF75503.1 MAG: putative toxin-antitoxin system toxin component, PIN family [Alphaproteobacteria bacterium]
MVFLLLITHQKTTWCNRSDKNGYGHIAFIEDFILAAEYVAIHEVIVACRDAKDDMFLELAVNGKADALVTGDKDLLVLHSYRGIPIITVREFLDSAI